MLPNAPVKRVIRRLSVAHYRVTRVLPKHEALGGRLDFSFVRIFSTRDKYQATNKMSDFPEEGARAPHFEGVTQDGGTVSLSDFEGERLALYFYPKDSTSGCTKQACNLRDNYEELREAGIKIVGVSGDSTESHQKFADKYDLPFPLIADTDKKIMRDYGVWGEKKLYGKTFLGTKRTTFLITEDGRIRKVIKRPKTGNHAAEVLAGFAE